VHFLWWAAGRSTNFRASNASREAKFRASRFLHWNKWKKSGPMCSSKEFERALSKASSGKRPGSSIGCWSKATPRRILRARWFANFGKKKVERRRADRKPRAPAAVTGHHCIPGNRTRGPNLGDAATIRLGSILPATRVQFGLRAILPHSNTPSLRVAGSEDEDENEAPGERTSSTVRVSKVQRLAVSPSIFNAPEKSVFRRGDKYRGTLKSSSRMLGLV
jgi:hypothetical protein